MTTTKAAAKRLAKGIEVGDFVLFGAHVLKMRVPVEGQFAQTHVQLMGLVTEVTPSGLLRVQVEYADRNYRFQLLSAKDSLSAVKLTPERVERRKSCRFGWD